MKFIKLWPETEKMLERIYHNSQHHQVRQRAHCILLSHRGWTMNELLEFLESVGERYNTGLVDGNKTD